MEQRLLNSKRQTFRRVYTTLPLFYFTQTTLGLIWIRFKKKRALQSESNADFDEQTNHHTHPPSKSNCEVAKVRVVRNQHATETVMINQQILVA